MARPRAAAAHRARCFVSLPRFTEEPSISGIAQDGQTLTGDDGTVANGAVTARQWKRDGVAIADATSATYILQEADIGAVITLTVTATGTLNPANVVSATSAPTAAVIA